MTDDAERGSTVSRQAWNARRASAWHEAIDRRDRGAARSLYEELGRVLDAEVAHEGGAPVLSSPAVNELIRKRVATLPGRRALDVGCGPTPVAAQALAGRGFTVAAVDVAHSIAAQAARRGGANVAVAVADGERLPFSDGSFDVVTCDDVVEHVFDQDAVMAELGRVVRPGGHLLLVTPNASAVHVLRARVVDRARGRRRVRRHYHVTASHVRELRWRELRRLVAPWFERVDGEQVRYARGGRWDAVDHVLALPGMWRLQPVHFHVLRRRHWRPPATTRAASPAAHYAGNTDVADQSSPAVVQAALTRAVDQHGLAAPVLDVGTGVGANLAALAGCRTVGVDVSLAALRTAADHAPVVAADAAHLPFRDSSFPSAVCTEVLEHVDDRRAVLDELARVLVPGGTLFVTTPNYANLAGVHKWLADRRHRRHDWNPWGAHRGGHEAFVTGRAIRRDARRRFEVVSVAALDYGQALTGRFRPLDRAAHSRAGRALLARALPVLHRADTPVIAWHGMHAALVLRRRVDVP